MNIRELVLDMLLEMERERVYSNILIRRVLDKYDDLPGKDKAFIKRLIEKRVAEGTLERRIQIDYIMDQFSKTPAGKMKPLIRNLLRMSVYQILFMDTVPDSAACNEAVKLAAKRKFQSLKGFVNGVLRNIAREKDMILSAGGKEGFYPDREKEPLAYLSVFYSMPEYFIVMWLEEYGMERTEKMLQAMLEVRPVTIRIRESLTEKEKEAILRDMEEAGIGAEQHPYLPYAYMLEHAEGVRNIPGFDEGLFAVQDVSSMISVECAGIEKGSFVVDVCAAPGGKSVHGAEKTGEKGRVLARDISEEKVDMIRENAERLRLENIEAEVFDATEYDAELDGKADVVLADVPCSGLGILGRKRDIKYHMTRETLAELPGIQRKILEKAQRYVKPGGILVYSTCTIRREENEENVRWFLGKFPFQGEDIRRSVAHIPQTGTAADGYLQLLPGIHSADGFFIAVFRRKGNMC